MPYGTKDEFEINVITGSEGNTHNDDNNQQSNTAQNDVQSQSGSKSGRIIKARNYAIEMMKSVDLSSIDLNRIGMKTQNYYYTQMQMLYNVE